MFDPISKGYDYYGQTINAAARIESLAAGGQIIASKSILDACNAGMPSSTTPLGMRSLRGIGNKIDLLQIDVLHRTYPPLREETDLEGDLYVNIEQLVAEQASEFSLRCGMPVDHIGEEFLMRNSLCRKEMLRTSTTLFLALSTCRKPSSRLSLVKQLCQLWHVDISILSRSQKKEAVDWCVWALAERLAQVSHEGDLMRASPSRVSELASPPKDALGREKTVMMGRSPQKVFF